MTLNLAAYASIAFALTFAGASYVWPRFTIAITNTLLAALVVGLLFVGLPLLGD